MKNLLLKISFIIILGIVICMSGVVQAAEYIFGIKAERVDSTGKYIYTFQTSNQSANTLRYIWNVQQYNNNIPDNEKVFYCLAQGYGNFGDFEATATPGQKPQAGGGISPTPYTGPYRLKDTGVLNTLRQLYSGKSKVTAFTEDKIYGLVWILDHMYIPGEDSKEDFLSEIELIDETGTKQGISVWDQMTEETPESTDDDLTDFDIEAVQQLAIWKITNGDLQANGFPKIYLSINNGDLKTYEGNFAGHIPDVDITYGKARELYMRSVYNYLVSGANAAQESTPKRPITEDTSTTILVYANAEAQPVVTITREKEIEGKYDVILKKVDENGNILPGAVFTVNNKDYTVGADGTVKIASDVQITEQNVGTPDTYTIVEKTAPAGYTKYEGTITATVSKKEATDHLSYIIENATLDSASNSSNKVSIDKTTNTITITVKDTKVTGKYDVLLKKVDENGKTLPGAVFTVNNQDYTTGADGLVKIASNVQITNQNISTPDIYTIVEKTAPAGYMKYDGTITATVTKKAAEDGSGYMLNNATLDNTSTTSGKVSIDHTTNTVTITVKNTEMTGKYDVLLRKVDTNGKIVPGAVFTVNNKDYTVGTDGTVKIATNIDITEQNVGTPDIYTIVEKTVPEGYIKYDGTIKLTITKQQAQDGISYIIKDAILDSTSVASGKVTIDKATNVITITIVNDVETKNEYIDLALRKFISKVVNTSGTTVYTDDQLSNRVPKVDTTNLKTATGKTTAEYNHTKKPVQVSVGDKVTYTLRVYNEGNVDAYITQITDYLSKYLTYVENEEWLRQYSENEEQRYDSKASTTTLTTITGASENLSSVIGKPIGDGILLPAYDKTNDKLSYIDVQITCEVLKPNTGEGSIEDYKITNIAEITGMADKNKNPVNEDIDSEPDNIKQPAENTIPGLPKTEQEWQEYKDNEIGQKQYIPGQEDDDDFEKVIILIPKYDLSLRKFIVQVDDKNLVDQNGKYIREPIVDTTTLKQGIAERGYGTATYTHPKTPITVRKGGTVTYIIRVYNEGNIDAYVSEITDHLPEYLEYIEDDEINKRFGWTYDKDKRTVKTTITSKDNDYSYKIYGKRENGKLLSAYTGGETLDYIDVAIKCKVSNRTITGNIQTNIAEITQITDTKGEQVEDLDSIPNGNLVIPPDEELPKYREELEGNPYVPGQEDDDDYEKVKVEGAFDLALRKFITKVNTTEVNNRYPQLSISENGNIKYTHTKEPLEVCTGDTVIYTIRIYNEGEIAGYANEITDDVPFGLEYIADNEINKEYRWKTLDENGQETTDVTKAKYIVTDYLSEEQERETGRNNLIKEFNSEAGISETNPDYRDVQIAFKVTYQVKKVGEESRVLVNVAQISADSDDDKDSKPNRDEEYDENYHEDDIDYENVKVKYFDLSLLKWVTKAIVVENGQTRVIESGHTGYERPEPDLKVEIKTSDVKKVSVKFAYKIKITNEGEIAGYAKEITDYIPDGLEFKQEDNPEWYVRGDKIVATAQLENKLLQPGETAEVEIILTWVNGEKNLGRKVNVAEISKDDNPSKTPDIDSTPDNKVPGEDDIDDAPVLLVIKTGAEIAIKYITLTTAVIGILGAGMLGIKKFVL